MLCSICESSPPLQSTDVCESCAKRRIHVAPAGTETVRGSARAAYLSFRVTERRRCGRMLTPTEMADRWYRTLENEVERRSEQVVDAMYNGGSVVGWDGSVPVYRSDIS